MSSLNAYHHNMSILFYHYSVFLFKIRGSFLWLGFLKHRAFYSISSVLRIPYSTCPSLRRNGFLLYYITHKPRNSKNPINKSDLLEAFHGGHVLNLGYFLFAQQTTGILRVKLNETMELSQVSQPLISYTHQCTLHMKSTDNICIFLTCLYLWWRMQYCKNN